MFIGDFCPYVIGTKSHVLAHLPFNLYYSDGSRTFPPPPGHLPPYEKWHVWTSAPQAIDRGGYLPPQQMHNGGYLPPLKQQWEDIWCSDISATDISATDVSAWTFRPRTFRPRKMPNLDVSAKNINFGFGMCACINV